MPKALPGSLRIAAGPNRFICLLVVLASFSASALRAQDAPEAAPDAGAWLTSGTEATSPQMQATGEALSTATARGNSGELVVAPIPFTNPTIGTGLSLGVGYIFRLDPEAASEPPSVVGLGGMMSDNGTWGLALGGKVHLDQDKYRVVAGLVDGSLVYDFYGIGTGAGGRDRSIEITQEGTVLFLQGLRRITPELYAGLRYIRSRATTSLDLPGDQLPPDLAPPPLEAGIVTAALGVRGQYDSRNSEFYPTDGTFADAGIDLYNGTFGSERKYQVYTAAYNRFISLDEKRVVALRGFARFTGGEPPFYALSMFGIHSDLRGFQVGRYRDRHMLSVQAEYRAKITRRLGAVVYAGAGSVAPTPSDLGLGLTGYGAGLRYQLTSETPLNYRVDWAMAEGESSLVFAVGEAF